jgi:hypothetical protein
VSRVRRYARPVQRGGTGSAIPVSAAATDGRRRQDVALAHTVDRTIDIIDLCVLGRLTSESA